jgi:leader peptidase (prepilin peptidase)/N-methyltransferase
MIWLVVIAVGLAFGSFANVLISRLKIRKNGSNQIDLVTGSYCDNCGESLAWYEIIPVISYIFLKGKCRNCGKPIPISLPLVELTCGLLSLILYFFFGLTVESGLLFLIGILLIAIFVYDLKNQLIPDYYIYSGLVLAVIYNIYLALSGSLVLIDLVYALTVGSGLLYLINVISHGEGMGMGDVKLMLVIGLVLGWPLTGLQVYLSFILGGIIGLVLIMIGNKNFKSQVPFGPILITGYFISLLYGNEILNYFFNHLIYL